MAHENDAPSKSDASPRRRDSQNENILALRRSSRQPRMRQVY